MKRTYLFLGPSLPADEAARLAPGVTILPPAAVGDVYRLARWQRPARIAIVDGYFERMAAVWHKEVLYALERGVEVWGAASMGALRAAELAPFGMVGIGKVFASFQSGRLDGDDEVAVRHLPASHGFRATSDALVNLREGLKRARRRGAIGARTHDRLVAHAKALFYPDRTWAELASLAKPLASLGPVDVKAADTRLLLRRMAATPPRRVTPAWRMPRTFFWDRFVELSDGGDDG
jgi:hypothetical protein